MGRIIAACLVLSFCLCTLAKGETTVADLNPPGKVTGRLGKGLGTRMTIVGILGHAMLANPLEVSALDGQALEHPVIIEIRGGIRIEQGKQYRLEGYESGEFGSQPEWLSPGAQQPFQFRSFFIVTKVIEPVESKDVKAK